jgi:hypothetical protein
MSMKKVAATVALIKGKRIVLDVGSNIAEQCATLKGILTEFGPGNDLIQVLFSAGRPAKSKKVKLPSGAKPDQIIAAGRKQVAESAKRAAKMAAEDKKKLAEDHKARIARHKEARARATGKKTAKATGK